MIYLPPFRGFVRIFSIICGVVFVLQALTLYGPWGGREFHLEFVQFFGLVPERFFKGLVFQALTWIFLHGNFYHLLFNLLAFWMFGSLLEQVWGTRKFARFILLSSCLTGLLVALFSYLDPQSYSVPTIGASGVVFAILVAVSRLFPNQIVLFFFIFPMKMRYFAYLMIGIEFYALYSSNQSGVSNIAHLSGAGVGFILSGGAGPGLGTKNWLKDFQDRWHQRRMRKKLRIIKIEKKITYH
jgi:membrane associated rhomboid family serine protease